MFNNRVATFKTSARPKKGNHFQLYFNHISYFIHFYSYIAKYGRKLVENFTGKETQSKKKVPRTSLIGLEERQCVLRPRAPNLLHTLRLAVDHRSRPPTFFDPTSQTHASASNATRFGPRARRRDRSVLHYSLPLLAKHVDARPVLNELCMWDAWKQNIPTTLFLLLPPQSTLLFCVPPKQASVLDLGCLQQASVLDLGCLS